ncbi:MAG TPA: alanine--tRNA ligase [Chloroflexota bacterium]|nr:alanine--tRNA ligase [Chloroflexota bacterium]
MTSDEIRSTFLAFFEERGHVRMPSSSLLPLNDPTVLLTPAGVHQMQPFFLGQAKPPAPRLTSCQKCFRTTDIESVGDERHLTFFEMLGNFSVGDYFKEGAIRFAWDLLLRLGFDADRLHVTVHPADDDAPGIWQAVGIPAERIHASPDNWWNISGSAGPCGPDTEIYLDRGAELGCGRADCAPGCECERYLEFWNLVFTEFVQNERNEIQGKLHSPNIDTGGGLERWALLLQGKHTVYETDLFEPLMGAIQQVVGASYGQDAQRDYGMRVLADHARAMTFLTADGLEPANEGRGYILRRVIRRAVRYGRLLGREQPFLTRLAEAACDRMSSVYPELAQRREHLLGLIATEEERFGQTLAQGFSLLNQLSSALAPGAALAGTDAFKLHDTYGFPLEVTREILAERGLALDEAGFQHELEAQRQRSRAVGKGGRTFSAAPDLYRFIRDTHGPTSFLGYETMAAPATVVAILVDGALRNKLLAGEAGEIVLDRTPFYATGGGQVGDTGQLIAPRTTVEIETTSKPLTDLYVHSGRVASGQLGVGDSVTAQVNEALRWDTARNHTGTHVLHAALRQVLGDHATQAGSVVDPERLRFDFHSPAPLSEAQVRQVEDIANEEIRRNDPVLTRVMTLDEAMADGAIGLFEEKYGDTVRVVSLPGFSKELCGGTHCQASGQIGELLIVGQESVGAGVRRIEALTGRQAARYVRERLDTLRALAQVLPGAEADLPRQVQHLLDELSRKDKQIDKLKREGAGAELEALVGRIRGHAGEPQVVAEQLPAESRQDVLLAVDRVRTLRFSGVVTLGAVVDEKPAFFTYVTPDLVQRGITAGPVVKAASLAAGGSGGGGRPELAQGGGRDPSKLSAGLEAAAAAAREALHAH